MGGCRIQQTEPEVEVLKEAMPPPDIVSSRIPHIQSLLIFDSPRLHCFVLKQVHPGQD